MKYLAVALVSVISTTQAIAVDRMLDESMHQKPNIDVDGSQFNTEWVFGSFGGIGGMPSHPSQPQQSKLDHSTVMSNSNHNPWVNKLYHSDPHGKNQRTNPFT